MVTLSVLSTAVNCGAPAVADVTVNVTTPNELEVPDAAEIVSVPPRLEDSVTVLPATGLLFASRSVTVMVEIVLPSAVTPVGLAATVDCDALTAPAEKTMFPLVTGVRLVIPAVAVAVSVIVSDFE